LGYLKETTIGSGDEEMERDIRNIVCRLELTRKDKELALIEASCYRTMKNKYAYASKITKADVEANCITNDEIQEGLEMVGEWGVWVSLTERGE